MASKLKPGESMRVHVLDNGMFVDAEKHPMVACDDEHELFDFPCWTALVETSEATVLYDCACNMDEQTQVRFFLEHLQCSDDQLLVSRLAQLGYGTGDIDYVVVSHLHPDHIGYLDLFTESKVVVSRAELTKTMQGYEQGTIDFAPYWEKVVDAQLDWLPLDDAVEATPLIDGVTVYNFGEGHSFGMLGLLLDLKQSGPKLLVSDAVYTAESVGPPVREPGFISNIELWRASLERILKLSDELGAQIWYGHDPEQFAAMVHAPEGFYE